MPSLSRITLYPVKALPGVEVEEARFTARGSLVHDREYALVDPSGNFISGKRDARVHALNASCTIERGTVRVTLSDTTGTQTYALEDEQDRTAVASRLSHYFDEPVSFVRDSSGGFPDDTDYPGPTIIAEASLATVADWYPGQTPADMRRRFRANLEVTDCPAFWEDQLYGDPGVEIGFRIGSAHLAGTNPCKRCVVPTRDPTTGAALPDFQRIFVAQRKATLPPWANKSRFEFYYRLAVNTRVLGDQRGKRLRVGDEVALA